MPDEQPLAAPSAPRGAEALPLRQADHASPATASLRDTEGGTSAEGRDWPQRGQARTDFAAIESNLEFIIGQLARVPARKQLARYSFLVTVGTACLMQTLADDAVNRRIGFRSVLRRQSDPTT
jgi:hypothetical protein